MLKADKKSPPHIRARQQLLSRIAALSAKGIERLPPERELCAEFGVILKTVQKAISQLVNEGGLVSVPRKGRFIRTVAAQPDIGIVIGARNAVTFIREPDLLGHIFDVLTKLGCLVRLIQLRNPEEASKVLQHYKIDGCIWYQPYPPLFPKISKIMENCSVPIVVPVLTYTSADAAKLPKNHFAIDFTGVGRVRAEYLIERGHRNIVYCAKLNTGTYDGFLSALDKVGVLQNPDWNIPNKEEIPERLPGILDSGEVTAIISDGGSDRLESVFRVLDRHHWNGRGELLVDFVGETLGVLRKNYPGVKVAAVNFYPHHEIGAAAAEALVHAVKEGRPVQSAKFASQVREAE
jgi:DNA-binding LacI/PurR family transcriptional regulator